MEAGKNQGKRTVDCVAESGILLTRTHELMDELKLSRRGLVRYDIYAHVMMLLPLQLFVDIIYLRQLLEFGECVAHNNVDYLWCEESRRGFTIRIWVYMLDDPTCL